MDINKDTVRTVAAIWFWLIAAVVTFSFFGEGEFIVRLRDQLYGQLEWGMYGIPPLLVLLSLLFFDLHSPIAHPFVSIGAGLMYVSVLALTQAGLRGEALFLVLQRELSFTLAFIVYVTVFVIGMLLAFNSSLTMVVSAIVNGIGSMFGGIGNLFQGSGSKEAPFKMKGIKDEGLPSKHAEPRQAPLVVAPTKNGPTIKTASLDNKPFVEPKRDLKISVASAPQIKDMSMWQFPSMSLLSDGPGGKADRGNVRDNAHTIEKTLESFGIKAKVEEVNGGPAVTQYALRMPLGIKVSRITALSSDLALALAAPTGSVRIEAPIPGRDLVGIEIPNRGLEFVTLKKMMTSDLMRNAKSKLTVAVGLDVSGNPLVADLAKMPHVLVAGTTGSGKSVLINVWITSLLCRTTPAEVRLIMVDPKRVELTGYNGIPHLLTPVITEPDKILSSLRWAVNEMEQRYNKFADVSVRNIEGFNELSGFQAMPYIVIFIDELADLMAYSPSEVEDNICRLAQKARAAGIHLVLSTQRPSVDVITGLIKANIPSRIAFNVSSMTDSRVVLDQPGAEKLLGRGDMLYTPADQSKPSRIQGTFVSEREVSNIVSFIKEKNPPVAYTEEVISQTVPSGGKKSSGGSSGSDGKDALFEDAARLVCQYDKASASLLQRKLKVGYARAARILDELEEASIIGPGEGAKPRDVLIKSYEEFLAVTQNQSADTEE